MDGSKKHRKLIRRAHFYGRHPKHDVVYLNGVKITPMLIMENGRFTEEYIERVIGAKELESEH